MKQDQLTINLPKQDARKLLNALSIFEEVKDEIEDLLIFQNKPLLKELKKSRKEHKLGKVKNWNELI